MRRLPAMLALVLACAASAPALAQGEPLVGDLAAVAEPMALDALDAEHGQGAGATVMSEQQLSAANSGNSIMAGTMQTGDVAFSTSALSGFAGVGNFVINTGNNSNLQGTISVNIVTNAAPL